MSKIQDAFYTASTISIIILSAFGVKLLHEKSVREKYEVQIARVRSIMGVSIACEENLASIYKLKWFDHYDLSKYHPLGANQKYVAIDAKDENDHDHAIRLSPIEMAEFAEYGLTRSLRKKIKVIPVNAQNVQ